MKVCLIHNHYGIHTGEEAVVDTTCDLLENHGHEAIPFFRSSEEIPDMRFGKIRAFFAGIYNPFSKRALRKLIEEQKPDLVHIHNLFPFISPAILPECRKACVPVVMTVHNFRLFCPTGLYMVNGEICRKCDRGEHWCFFRNCTGSLYKSLGYALRNFIARKCQFYRKNVTMYATLTEFQRQIMIQKNYPASRITVIPNTVRMVNTPPRTSEGEYVACIGRISPEKGLPVLMGAAEKCKNISFKSAGSYDRMPDLPAKAPKNFQFLGNLDIEALKVFYQSARILALPTICYEGFPVVVIEAMLHKLPVIVSRIGGLPEIVDDGKTGLLFNPGNEEELAKKIRYLWERPELCGKVGEAGREKALSEYSPARYYERLMVCYEKAIEFGAGGPR